MDETEDQHTSEPAPAQDAVAEQAAIDAAQAQSAADLEEALKGAIPVTAHYLKLVTEQVTNEAGPRQVAFVDGAIHEVLPPKLHAFRRHDEVGHGWICRDCNAIEEDPNQVHERRDCPGAA